MPRGGRRLTTPEMDEFILAHYRGTGHREMAEMVNARFGTRFTVDQVKAYYGRNHLDSGLTGRFEKGRVPTNKGKTWAEYMLPESQERCRATQYKEGNRPHNGGVPVGTVRLRNGKKGSKPQYWREIAEPNAWIPEHRAVWEEHNGPVPDGMMVTFANGDALDCRIENLVLETRAEHAVKNRMGIRSSDAEAARAANATADLIIAAAAARRRGRGKRRDGG